MSDDAHARPTRDAPEPLYDVNLPTPYARGARANIGRPDLDRDPLHAGAGAGGLPLRLVRDRRLRQRNPHFPYQRTRRAHQELGAGSSRVAAGVPREALQILSPTDASPSSDRARASKGIAAARVPHSSPLIRTPATTLTSAISRSGSCRSIMSATLGVMAGCRGSAKRDWQAAEPDPLGPSAAGMMAHMNADHADAMVLYCTAFSKADDHLREHDRCRQVRLRDVSDDP